MADWTAIPPAEWTRRLTAARAAGLAFVAEHGINTHTCEPSIAGMVLEESIGAALLPTMKDEQREVEEHIRRIGDPVLKLSDNDAHECLSDRVFGYAMATADAGFLLGVLVGCGLSWELVSRIPANVERAPTTPTRKRRT